MSQTERIVGFILKKKSLLGKDEMVVLFTQELGKIRVFAKGVRTFKSKRSAHLQSGNLIKAHIYTRKSIRYIQSTDLISGFVSLRKDTRIDAMYLLLGCIDGLLPEDAQEKQVYRILMKSFIKLSQPEVKSSDVLCEALNALLQTLGYSDQTYSLSQLTQKIEEHTNRMLPKHVIINN